MDLPHTPKDFRSFLQEELLKRVQKNPNYSLRSFAKNLDVSHSALVEMLSGKRSITSKTIEKLGFALGLRLDEIQEFQRNCKSQRGFKITTVKYQKITLDMFAIISDWYHFAILELIKIRSFNHSAENISKALGISLAESRSAVDRLLNLEIITRDKQGQLIENNEGFATSISENLTSYAAKQYQRQILQQSIDALMTIPLDQRNHTSITMAIDPKHLPLAIKKITKFRRELSELMEKKNSPTEVYQLSISLFPVSNLGDL